MALQLTSRSDLAFGHAAAVGGTPLVELRRLRGDRDLTLHAKLEGCNPGGSSKDRSALEMLAAALETGELTAGGTVVESTSGNLGVGLAAACRQFDLDLVCVVDERAPRSSRLAMQALGAEVIEVRAELGQDLLAARLQRVQEVVHERPGAWWPDQYSNPANPRAHSFGTMREIDDELGDRLDVLFVATSTTGTLRGCGDFLRERERDVQLVAVDALGSALFGGEPGQRRLSGLGAGVETEHSLEADHDLLSRVSDLDCVVGCRRLARAEGILAGASSGGLVTAFERVADTFCDGATCVLILPDRGQSYLDTVYDDEWVSGALGVEQDELDRLVR